MACRLDINTNDVVALYRAGHSAAQIEKLLSVSKTLIYARLRSAGIDAPGRRHPLDVAAIKRLYLAGESVKALAARFKVSRPAIDRRLREQGVDLRNRSASMYVRMARATPEQRAAWAEAAHDAVRGKPAKGHEKRAKTYEHRGFCNSSPQELRLIELLKAAGVEVTPQKAIGYYNCDIAIPGVAVEIFGGNWHGSGRRARRQIERTRFILNSGWDLLVILSDARSPVTPATADYIVAYAQERRANQAARREYRVIRCTGELVASGCADTENIAFIGPTTITRDKATGRYKSIPR